MKLPKEVVAILSNKYVLYVVAFLAITNVIGYLAVQDFTSLLFFVLIGYLTSYFSKNMTVVLLSALVLTNLLMSTRRVSIKEGMASKTNPKMTTEEESEEEEENDDESPGMKGPVSGVSKQKNAPEAASQAMDAAMAGEGGKANVAGKVNVEELSPDAVRAGIEQMGGKNFAEQQRMIKENLESIKPMLSTAKEMLDTLKGAKDMIGQFGGLSDMLPGM